jgi:LysM domain
VTGTPPEPDPRKPSAPVRNRTLKPLGSALAALVAVMPAAAIASEPDSAEEGASAPGHQPDVDSPSFDPGGDTALPFDTGPPPPGAPQAESPDAGPLESEPLDDPDVRAAPAEPDGASSPEGGDAVPPLEGSPPAAPADPGFNIEPPPESGVSPGDEPATPPEAQSLGSEPHSDTGSEIQKLEAHAVVAVSRGDDQGSTPQDSSTSPPSGGSTEVGTDGGEVVVKPIADVDEAPASRPARFHTVRPGESLWSIAQQLAGPDASTASIALSVARLWHLNRDRIASGDPDVILTGTKLRLR